MCAFFTACVLFSFNAERGPDFIKCFKVQPAHFKMLRSSKKKQKEKKIFACPSADQLQLTMWIKSTGVAVYKSQCSLSRMILSMRRISAVEKLHPLCTTRSLTEPITCYRHQRKENKHTVFKIKDKNIQVDCAYFKCYFGHVTLKEKEKLHS